MSDTFEAVMESPLGPLGLVATHEALVRVDFDPAGVAPDERPAPSVLLQARRELEEYFAGQRRTFDVPTRLDGTPFQRAVWAALRDIPWGQTVSYGELARRLGRPTASRAVGAANGANPVPIIVPCHRVIGANGALTGYGGGEDRKRWLLAHEGQETPRLL
ncbi:MAG: methylated-DNA--[protein]-cysteine S-methyltransferase [Deltaproteobacteria bacterium]|nr:MAG: methylated-DNA--[protein]-cysteine S-methyltransferase [Deltaproteobacteria bacterium]